VPDNFSTNALVSVKPHTGGLPHPILEQVYCKNPKGVVVHCLHDLTSSDRSTRSMSCVCAKSGTPASSQSNTWRGVRPGRPVVDQSPVRATSFKRHRILSPIRRTRWRRSARRHVAHTARGVRAPIRRRTDSGPFVSAAAAVTPGPVVVVSSG